MATAKCVTRLSPHGVKNTQDDTWDSYTSNLAMASKEKKVEQLVELRRVARHIQGEKEHAYTLN